MINLFLISEQETLKDNIGSWLKAGSDIKLSGAVNKNMASLRNLRELNADVIAVDIDQHDPPGMEIIMSIKKAYASSKILVLYPEGTESELLKIYEEGIKGFLMKETNMDDFGLAIKKLYRDKKFICTELAMVMLQSLKEKTTRPASEKISADISKREMEVLHLISDGYTNHEIADKLFTSRRTVETHRKNLIQKTETKNTAHLIKYAVHHGIIK
jgi:DNA-binding NarL/FixJ family response regulator